MKVIVRETEKTKIVVDIILYLIYAVVGFLLLKYPEIEVLKPIQYASPLFYMFGFFSIVSYFINRRKNDYEFLLLGLINIVVATFIMYYSAYDDTGFILGNAILIYSIALVLNKGWHTIKLSRKMDLNMFPKFSITILLTLLGLLVITNLYKETTMQTLILGYYFMAFGLLSLVEPMMIMVMKNKKVRNYLVSALEDNYKNDKEPIKEVKINKIEKPVIKESTPVVPVKHEKVINKANKKINNYNKKNVIKQPLQKKKNK